MCVYFVSWGMFIYVCVHVSDVLYVCVCVYLQIDLPNRLISERQASKYAKAHGFRCVCVYVCSHVPLVTIIIHACV